MVELAMELKPTNCEIYPEAPDPTIDCVARTQFPDKSQTCCPFWKIVLAELALEMVALVVLRVVTLAVAMVELVKIATGAERVPWKMPPVRKLKKLLEGFEKVEEARVPVRFRLP